MVQHLIILDKGKADCAYLGSSMMYLVLLFTILLIWAVVYPLTDRVLLSPPSLILLMLAFASALSLIGCLYWNEVELSTSAYFVIVVGCLGVLVAALIARNLFLKNSSNKLKSPSRRIIVSIAHISASRWLVLSLFIVIAALVNIQEMMMLAQEAGYSVSNFMDAAQWARGNVTSLLTSGSGDADESYSALASGLAKIITFCGYASVIGIAAKIKDQQKNFSNYYAVALLLLLTVAFSLLKGGRDVVAHYVVAFLIALFAFYLVDSKNRAKTSMQFLKIGVIAVIIALPLFYFALELVGRVRSVSLLDYISFYFGGGIPSLSVALEQFPLYFNDPVSGEKTFTQLYSLLNKIGLIGPVDAYADTFVMLNGHSSNIFTCFYRYYCDFGYIGVFLFSGLATLVFSFCFKMLESSPSFAMKIISVYICSYAADVAREEFVFSRLLSASLLWAIIAGVIIGCVLMYKRNNENRSQELRNSNQQVVRDIVESEHALCIAETKAK